MSDGQGSCSNGGIERGENMSDMREPKPKQPKLQLISIERTESGHELWTVKPASIRKGRNRAIIGIEVTAVASLLLNVIQSVIIYVLQAGPI